MRVLYVSPFPPARDGIGTYTQAIVNALRSRGHEAAVIVPRADSAANPAALGMLKPNQRDLASLRDTAVAWRPDCIHLQFAVAAFGTRTYALLSWLRLLRSTGIPVIVTMHEVTRDLALLRGPGLALYRKLAARCDHVIVHTRQALEECVDTIDVPSASVSVIPHPKAVPPAEVVSSKELRDRFGLDDADLLLAFGFIHVDKGLPDLVEALRMIRVADERSLDNVRLVIAGTVRRRSGLFRLFELRDNLHFRHALRKARRGNIERNIVLTGYVPEAEIAGWFNAAAAVVLPYRRTEQSGVAALANAFGVPALASTVGGLDELYRGSDWTFPPRNPGAIAHVLSGFLATPASGRLSVKGSHPDTDLDTVVSQTLGVYRSVGAHASTEIKGLIS